MKKKLEYYSASWCGPCKMSKPIILNLIEEGYNIEVIDIDGDAGRVQAQSRRITSVPTLVLLEEGKPPRVHMGMLQPDAIRRELNDGGRSDTIDI